MPITATAGMLSLENRHTARTLLDAACLQTAENGQTAIIYVESGGEDTVVARGDFQKSAQRYAAALRQMGVRPGDLVVIAHIQNLESIFAFWGALLIGAVPSMFPTLTEKLDPHIYMANMAELVALSDVRVVLTTDELAAELDEAVGCPVYGAAQTAEFVQRAGDSEPFQHSPDPDGIAFLQHSSGTTGLQKGVALSHRAVLNQLAGCSEAIALDGNDVIASWLPLYHDMGLIAGFMLPLFQGVPLVLMSPFDWVRNPALLLQAMHRCGGTLTWLPNFAYNHMARRIRDRDIESLDLSHVRMFINCSEPVRADSHSKFHERFAALGVRAEQLAVSYAMAENTFAVTQTPPGTAPRLDIVRRNALEEALRAEPAADESSEAVTLVSCGPPIANTAVRVLSEDGTVLDERQVGELAVRSDCMLSGYYKRPDLQPFRDGWYLTGDRGYVSEGEVFIIGRSKDLIINAGKNVYPQDIEAIVNEVPGVHAGRAVAFGVPDEREGTELIAVVAEVRSDDTAERKQIGKRIRQEVARQSMVTVSYVQLVDERWLIKTSSGKIARAANREKWRAERREAAA